MERLSPVLQELRERLERLGYVVVPHGDHLCVRLALLTSVRVRLTNGGDFRFVPQFGPFRRTGGVVATSVAAVGAVALSALTAGAGAITAVVAFGGVVALAHDACRFVLTEGALTRLQLLTTDVIASPASASRLAGAPDAALPPPSGRARASA